jgi:DNA-binding MurR/RpiR family transcriptional regulator
VADNYQHESSREAALTELIGKSISRLGPSRRVVVEYMAAHLEEVAFWPLARLAQAVSVSESAVVRAARDLGFSGYPKLQQHLQDVVKERLFRVARRQLDQQSTEPAESLYERVRLGSLKNLEHAYRANTPQVMQQAAALALGARRIGVVGSRVGYPVVTLLSFYLKKLLGNADAWHSGDDTLIDSIRSVGPGDLVIGVAFRSYGRRTVRAVQIARSRGASVIAVTDTAASPLSALADVVLLSETENSAVIRSLVGPVAIAEQFLAAVVQQASSQVTRTLDDLKAVALEFEQ